MILTRQQCAKDLFAVQNTQHIFYELFLPQFRHLDNGIIWLLPRQHLIQHGCIYFAFKGCGRSYWELNPIITADAKTTQS